MPQNHQFIEDLIQLRSHYQSVFEDSERLASHVSEQLNHINALLVDQLVENQQVAQTLMQLRSHYQALHQQHQQKAACAKEQRNHVNALLADQAVLQHSQQQPISIQAATLEQLALSEALPKAVSEATIADNSEESPQQELGMVEEPQSPQLSRYPIDFEQAAQDQETELQEHQSPEVAEPQTPTGGKQALASHRHSAPLKTQLLTKYQHLTKSAAVEKLLQENQGNVLHVDYIIRALYGELEPEDIKAEKLRMFDTLKKGVAKGLWDRVPDTAGCYTIDLKLVEKEVDSPKADGNKRQGRKSNSKAAAEMLPRYQNLNLTEAVETVVRENPGEILTSDLVARALYADLSGQALTQAKMKIGKTLWSGAKQGRWQSVIGKLGAYTLDTRKLK